MRAIFGLVGILIALGVLIYFLGPGGGLEHTQQVVEQGKKARQEAQQLAGRDESGMRIQDSITLDPQIVGGRLNSILVTDIVANGPMARFFGLQRNDSIIQIGPLRVQDLSDSSLAKDMVYEAYQRQQQLIIIRNDRQMTLPHQPAPAPSGQPANPTPPPSERPLDRQLRGIGVPTH